MSTSKLLFALGLTLALGVFASCRGKDEPNPTPTPQPQSGIKIEKGVLLAYPENEIKEGTVTLPEVTEIAAKVFEGYKTLKKVEATKLTKIGASAFEGSTLTSLTLGEGIPSVGEKAFEGTPTTKALIVPAAKASDYRDFARKYGFASINGTPVPAEVVIKDGVLIEYPASLTPTDGIIRLETSVTEIGANVFMGNTQLKEIHAPGVKKVGSAAFKNCTSLTKVNFGAGQRPPLSITENDEYNTAEDAFWGTPEEKVLVFDPKSNPNYLQYLKYIALHHFGKLDGIEIPQTLSSAFVVKDGTLTEIRNNRILAGQGKNGLLVLPNSIKKIGELVFDKTFQNFRYLYAEGVEEIENYAFNETGSLNFAHLPALKKIGDEVFTKNASLSAVNFPQLETMGKVCFSGSSGIAGNGQNITYMSLPKIKKIGQGSISGNYRHPVVFVFGAAPEVDLTKYSDPGSPVDESITFKELKPTPILYVTPAHKATYSLTGDQWNGLTVREMK